MPIPSRRIILAIVLSLLVGACASARPGQAVSPSPARAAEVGTDTAGLLTDSWASNGQQGFFVEGSTLPQAMSLYATRWELAERLAQGEAIPRNLDRAGMAQWLAPLAAGSPSAAGDVTTLPMLARISDAVATAEDLHAPVDASLVSTALETLREGDSYRANPGSTGGTPNWGNTSIALSVYSMLGRPAPARVVAAAAVALTRALSDRTPADVFSFTLPVLSAAPVGALKQSAQVAAELTWMLTFSTTLPPVERLSLAATVRPILEALGLPRWSATRVCSGVAASDDGVAESVHARPDPQLTTNALAVGCLSAVASTPWTPLGWPSGDAISTALPASVDGLRVALTLHASTAYIPSLRNEVSQVWAPEAASASSPQQDIALDLLSGLLSEPPVIPEAASEATLALQAGVGSGPTSLLFALVTHPHGLEGAHPPKVTSSSSNDPGGQGLLADAVSDELISRLSDDSGSHAAAVQAVTELRAEGSDLYGLAVGAGPSLTATVLAAWIERRPFPMAALDAAGLCTASYACVADQPSAAAPPQLQVAAAAAALADPKDGAYPYAF